MPRVKISRQRAHKLLSLTPNQSASTVDNNANNTSNPRKECGVYVSKQFPPNLLLNMNDLRENQRFCDIEIVCAGKHIKVSIM